MVSMHTKDQSASQHQPRCCCCLGHQIPRSSLRLAELGGPAFGGPAHRRQWQCAAASSRPLCLGPWHHWPARFFTVGGGPAGCGLAAGRARRLAGRIVAGAKQQRTGVRWAVVIVWNVLRCVYVRLAESSCDCHWRLHIDVESDAPREPCRCAMLLWRQPCWNIVERGPAAQQCSCVVAQALQPWRRYDDVGGSSGRQQPARNYVPVVFAPHFGLLPCCW